MGFDRPLAYVQRLCGLLVALARGHTIQDLHLTMRESGFCHAMRELRHYVGREIGQSAVGADYRIDEIPACRVLEKVPFRARADSGIDVVLTSHSSEDKNSRSRIFFADLSYGFDAIHAGHAQVHQCDIRTEFAIELDSLTAIRGEARDFELILCGKQSRQSFAGYRVIVCNQDSYRGMGMHSVSPSHAAMHRGNCEKIRTRVG